MRAVITTENDDYDITSKIQVLNTASAASGGPSLYTARVVFGDSVKDLDGTGGTFELYIEVDGIPIEPYPQEIKFSTETSTSVFTAEFWAGNSEDIDVYVKSPNAGDSDVDVTVTLLDVSPLQSVTRGYDTAISSTGVVEANIKEVGDVGITDIDDFKANLTTLEQFASADWKINTSDATLYQIVFYAAGTVTEIARKDLFDSDGNSVIALTTPIASMTKA